MGTTDSPGPTFLFAGGGTGGHLFPGLAVADELRSRDPGRRILFAGSDRDVERRILAEAAVERVELPSESTASLRRRPWRFLSRNWRAIRAAGRLVERVGPRGVVGLGGFASAPVVVAAWRRGVPVVLLEQNVVPGRATVWLSRLATAVCTSFPETAAWLPRRARSRATVTGNPVRREIADVARAAIDLGVRTLLVLGGSQGARPVNAAFLAAAERLRDRLAGWRIVHQTGPTDCDQAGARYRALGLSADVASFFDDLPARYREATCAVSRAGATTLAELACAGCPAILIPYPHAARDHQTHNAEAYARAGAAEIVVEGALPGSTADALVATLRRWIDDNEPRPSGSGSSLEASELNPLPHGRGSLTDGRDTLTSCSSSAARRAAMRNLARPDAAAAVADVIGRALSQPSSPGASA